MIRRGRKIYLHFLPKKCAIDIFYILLCAELDRKIKKSKVNFTKLFKLGRVFYAAFFYFLLVNYAQGRGPRAAPNVSQPQNYAPQLLQVGTGSARIGTKIREKSTSILADRTGKNRTGKSKARTENRKLLSRSCVIFY